MPAAPRSPRRPLLAVGMAALLVLSACTDQVTGTGHLSAVSPPAHSGGASTPVTSPAGPTASPSGTSPAALPADPVTPAKFVNCDTQLNLTGLAPEASLAGKLKYSCDRYQVPLDYTKPTGTQITLQLWKIHDVDNTHSLGDLFVNPGGPGGSGLQFAAGLLTEIPPSLLDHFDLLAFDPRGVGFSTPVTCITDKQMDAFLAASPDVLTNSGFAAAKALNKSFATSCSQKYGAALADYNTVNTARDMDRIRAAIGDPQMNYLGFSYGTELGSVYAHLFPSRIRVAVLDGAVDPLTSGIVQDADQIGGFESAFDQFAADCLKRSDCKSLKNPRQVVYQIQAATEQSPLPTGTPRPLTPSLATQGVLEALYSRDDWDTLGKALISAEAGNGAGLLALADQYSQRDPDGTYSNLLDVYAVVSCNDQVAGPSDAMIRTTIDSWVTEYPMFGRWNGISLFQCQQWQPIRTVPPKPLAATSTKVLVIGNIHDPATPYQGAKDLTTTMGNAELLTWDGEGHTSYLEGSSCIDNYVNNYLISKKLPPQNTTCPP